MVVYAAVFVAVYFVIMLWVVVVGVQKGTHMKHLGCHIEGFTYLIMKKGARDTSGMCVSMVMAMM